MSADKAAEKRAWFDASWDPEVPLVPAEDLDPSAQAVMERGEQLLWTGRAGSIRGLYTQTAGAFGCWGCALGALTGIPIGLIAYFHSLGDDAAVLLAFAFAIAFGEGILGCVVALIPSLREAGAVYAITDRRAFRIRRVPWRSVTSYRKLDPLSVRAVADAEGRGNLLFADERWETPWGAVATPKVGFFGVPAVRQVEKLLLAVAMRPHARAVPAPAQAEKGADLLRDHRSRSASRRAVAMARLLHLDAPALDRALEGADVNVYLLRALGLVGVWRAIGSLGAQAILDGLDGRPEQRQAAAEAIARLDKDAVVSLIRAWPQQDDAGKERLLAALEYVDEGILAEALGDALLDRDRMAAVWVAEHLEVPPTLRGRVIEGWVRQGPAAVEPLLDAVRGSGVSARYWAAEALGRLAAQGHSEQIRAALSLRGPPADGAVAAALAYAGDASGVGTLIRRFGEWERDVLLTVAGALGHLGSAAAPALDALRREARATEDQEVRSRCWSAIRRIQDALGRAPSELEAASAPAGTGTEPEAALPPEGTGTEVEVGPRPRGHARPPTQPVA